MFIRITCCVFALICQASMANILESVSHHEAKNKGVKIHYVTLGDSENPLVVFVHRFPDFWYIWCEQMDALKDDYRVAAMDLRGYNLSDKPKGVEKYALPHLIDDVAAVIAAEERQSAIIVGHDWGGMISWGLAMNRPELVSHLIILSLPHPRDCLANLRTTKLNKKRASTHTVFKIRAHMNT